MFIRGTVALWAMLAGAKVVSVNSDPGAELASIENPCPDRRYLEALVLEGDRRLMAGPNFNIIPAGGWASKVFVSDGLEWLYASAVSPTANYYVEYPGDTFIDVAGAGWVGDNFPPCVQHSGFRLPSLAVALTRPFPHPMCAAGYTSSILGYCDSSDYSVFAPGSGIATSDEGCFHPCGCCETVYVRPVGTPDSCVSNQPPVAICKSVTRNSPGLCADFGSFLSIDNGSSDPDGNLVSCVQDNLGPYPIGVHTVTLTCTDSEGLTDSCQGSITINDIDSDGDGVLDCDDNCPHGFNPGQEDADTDGFGDLCDNCPTVENPDQDLSACVDECTDPCTSVLSDDFDDYTPGMFDPTGTDIWASADGADVASNCGVVSPGNALTFGARDTPFREVISKPLFGGFTDLTLSFSLKIGHAINDNVCEDADDYFYDQDDEDVDLAFYIGGNWITYAVFDTEAYNSFTCIEVAIPPGATQFKIFQPSYSGDGFDEWAIDDVQIKSCECCHPLLTATIDVDPPEALYYAANGRTGFVACFSDQYPQLLESGYQDCSAPGAPQLFWNGMNGSDGLDPPAQCVAQGEVTDTGGYCIHNGWMPMMGSTCCADLSFTGPVPINGGTQFLQCNQGQECAVQDCGTVPGNPDPVQLLFDINCEYDLVNGCCNYPWAETLDPTTFSDCMPQGNSDRLLIVEEDDHNLRGAGH